MPESSAVPVASLYVHVPFCAQKCAYCAFYSEASSGELMNRYVGAVQRELELIAADLKPKTIFFGGGTPSLLNLCQWEAILRTMDRLGLLGAEEFTVECNPATVSVAKAELLRSFGVNRISMGVQSLDEALLDRLGRVHTREMVFRSFDVFRNAGFENLNLDLMFAIPGQTLAIWKATLDEALALGSEHISSYEVIYEEDTALYAQLNAREFEVDDDLACDMFEMLVERTGTAGFEQYEVANFARKRRHSGQTSQTQLLDPLIPAYACKHNVNYWRGGDFHGLGPSATSYVRGVRTKNRANTRLYCDQLECGHRAFESLEQFTSLKRAGETAAFGLRMNAGWPFEDFHRVTGHDLRGEWEADMHRLVQQGWALRSSERFQLTPHGLRFADSAAEYFLR